VAASIWVPPSGQPIAFEAVPIAGLKASVSSNEKRAEYGFGLKGIQGSLKTPGCEEGLRPLPNRAAPNFTEGLNK
jgi:hypothetical protein